MIDGLIAGRILNAAEQRTDKFGKYFVVAKVRASTAEGESIWVNVIAFNTGPCTVLLDLKEGDSVSLTGSLTPRVWTDKQGNNRPTIDLVAQRAIALSDAGTCSVP